MFLVFGISTFGVTLSLLYLCSVNPNTGKSILKFSTFYSKNKLFNHRKEKGRHLSWQIIINFYIHLCLHLISPPLPIFFFLVLDLWLMAQVTETSNDPDSVVQINHTHLCWIEKKNKGQVISILQKWCSWENMVRWAEFGLKSKQLHFSNCVLQLRTIKSAFCTFKCLIQAECKRFHFL